MKRITCSNLTGLLQCLFFCFCLSGWQSLQAQLLKQPIPDRLVVLSFDDAAVTHATYVAPLLKKYGFGATFYVCEFPPDFADTTKYMTWQQIRQLQQMGFEIGNHTGSHTHLNAIDSTHIVRELEVIEDRCIQHNMAKPTTFAYPAYDTDPLALPILKRKGYQFARVGGSRPYDPFSDHPYLIPSYSTSGTDTSRIMQALRQAKDGKIVVLTVHGVPDFAHDWVTTPPELFESYLNYLKDHQYRVIGMRELANYIDPEEALQKIRPVWTLGSEGIPVADQLPPTRIQIDFTRSIGPMKPIYSWFGYDEPNYTYMKDGRKLLTELAALSPAPVYVRTHNLLTTGDGIPALKWGSTNAYTEDADGNPVYNWQLTDSIFDTYVQRGMKPLVEIGFMPKALSSNPIPYRHNWQPGNQYANIFTGWAYPPKDYQKWGELIHQWVLHCVERYGQAEVETWLWEVWNEPNIGYWQGTAEEYQKLYDFSAEAVKRALPGARIGGPHSTGPGWDKAAAFLDSFLYHVENGTNYATSQQGSPLDFIAFHAKGAPKFVDGHVRMNMGAQLNDIARGFEIVASHPRLKHLPIIIGESDPEGCAACSMDVYPHNGYRNGTMYSSYTAAAFPRKMELADHYGVNLLGAVTWAFEFEDQPWFHGFRDLSTNGVDKPVLNVFRMMGQLSGSRVPVTGDLAYDAMTIRDSSVRGPVPDISALATVDDHQAAVLLWNYHDEDLPAQDANIRLTLSGLPAGRLLMQHFRIDRDHSNAYTTWQQLGSPQYPDGKQYTELEEAGKLELLESPKWIKTSDGRTTLTINLPRQGVSLLKFTWD